MPGRLNSSVMPDEWKEISAEVVNDVDSMMSNNYHMVAQMTTEKDDQTVNGTVTTVKTHKKE